VHVTEYVTCRALIGDTTLINTMFGHGYTFNNVEKTGRINQQCELSPTSRPTSQPTM